MHVMKFVLPNPTWPSSHYGSITGAASGTGSGSQPLSPLQCWRRCQRLPSHRWQKIKAYLTEIKEHSIQSNTWKHISSTKECHCHVITLLEWNRQRGNKTEHFHFHTAKLKFDVDTSHTVPVQPETLYTAVQSFVRHHFHNIMHLCYVCDYHDSNQQMRCWLSLNNSATPGRHLVFKILTARKQQ